MLTSIKKELYKLQSGQMQKEQIEVAALRIENLMKKDCDNCRFKVEAIKELLEI